MPRKTPPVSKQVILPFRPSNALFQARLIDFDTGSAVLEEQHKAFLRHAISRASLNSRFYVRILGFASRLGDAAMNQKLSNARIQSVFTFMRSMDGRVLNNLDIFAAFGETNSGGGEKNNSPEYRAVEVHVFIGDMPPLDPPEGRRVNPPFVPVLPGGPRSGFWSVAAPGGATFTVGPSIVVLTAGVTFGANYFQVRNDLTMEVRKYAAVALGLGVAAGLPAGFKSLKNILQTLFTGPNFSGVSFTKVFPPHAVTFDEIETCLVSVLGANGGAGVSGSVAVITFHCPGVTQFGPSGVPLKIPEDIWSFNSAGKNYQIGLGGSSTGGPLIRL